MARILTANGTDEYVQGSLVSTISGDFILKAEVKLIDNPSGTSFSNILSIVDLSGSDYLGVAVQGSGGNSVAKIISNGKTGGSGTTIIPIGEFLTLELRYTSSTNLAGFYINGAFEYSVNPTSGGTWVPTLDGYRFFSGTGSSSFGEVAIEDGCSIEDSDTPANSLLFSPSTTEGLGLSLPEITNSQDGTLTDYTDNDLQWVFVQELSSSNKGLNTGNTLYSNIIKALSNDIHNQRMFDVESRVATDFQSADYTLSSATTYTIAPQQGIARDATHWFGSGNSGLEKTDLVNNVVATNNSPYSSLPVGSDHLGDGFVDDTYFYVGYSNFSANVSTIKGIAIYLKSDLSYDSHVSFDAVTEMNPSSLCLSKDGAEILIATFTSDTSDDVKSRRIHRVNYTTKAYISYYTLDFSLEGMQGIAYVSSLDLYAISSWATPVSRIRFFDTDFKHKGVIQPSADLSIEIEGLECYSDTLYYHKISDSPRTIAIDSLYISTSLTRNEPLNVLESSDINDEGTILLKMKPESLFNNNTVLDNDDSANDWEAYISSAGVLNWRVNSSNTITSSGIVADTEYIFAFSWDNNAGTVTTKIGVDGVYDDTTTGTWVTPPSSGLWFGGVNASNTQSDIVYMDLIEFDKVLSDAELLDSYTNFDDFYAGTSGVIIPILQYYNSRLRNG